MERTFNSYGGSVHLRPLQALLEMQSENFGTSVTQLIFELNFANKFAFEKQGVNRSLEGSYHSHNSRLEKLPKFTFRRKKQELEIQSLATFADAEEFERFERLEAIPETVEEIRQSIVKPRKPKPVNELDLHKWNVAACRILVSAIEECKRKFKASDDFDHAQYIRWLNQIPESLPSTFEATNELLEQHESFREKIWDAKSDWERLSLDWELFHKDAREIISNPKLWNQSNDFSPNGNDAGADILADVIEQRKELTKSDGKSFYQAIWREWGFDITPPRPPNNTIESEEHRKLILGCTFAFLKVYGECPDWMISSSIMEIDSYRQFVTGHHKDWPHLTECLEHLDAMEAVLRPLWGANCI